MASHAETPLSMSTEEMELEEPNEEPNALVRFPSSHRAQLAEEDEEPNEIRFPRRRNTAHRPGLVITSSPLFIEPIMNRSPYDPDEFTQFLAPYLMDGDEVLHLGCQDGAISFTLCAKVHPTGHVYAINSPGRNTKRAEQMARTLHVEDQVTFLDVDNLMRLPFGDDSFDVVYASDLMVHLPPMLDHEVVIRVLAEMNRVTRPSGIIASRDLAAQHFFPNHDLIDMVTRTLFKASGLTKWYGPLMPTFYTRVGLKNFAMSCSTSSPEGPAVSLKMAITDIDMAVGEISWAEQLVRLFAKGTEVRDSWIGAGVHEVIINLISDKLREWGKLTDPWYVCLYTEMLAQKPKPAPRRPAPDPPALVEPAPDSGSDSSTSTARPPGDDTSDPEILPDNDSADLISPADLLGDDLMSEL
ncbi:S-adenosyl-L-methionine-dependent methyltransferase [Xylaria flabelliformis]|nr:S-adenosyl-L-methionine-dependent methyltransferase [Xylaria flabelliformis]